MSQNSSSKRFSTKKSLFSKKFLFASLSPLVLGAYLPLAIADSSDAPGALGGGETPANPGPEQPVSKQPVSEQPSCTDPTAQVNNSCPAGSQPVSYFSAAEPNENRCIEPPPDWNITIRKTAFRSDFAAHELDRCKKGEWVRDIKCTTVTFDSDTVGGRRGNEVDFRYNTVEGTPMACLQQIALDSFAGVKAYYASDQGMHTDATLDFNAEGDGGFKIAAEKLDKFDDLTARNIGMKVLGAKGPIDLASYNKAKEYYNCDKYYDPVHDTDHIYGFFGLFGTKENGDAKAAACETGSFVLKGDCTIVATADVQKSCDRFERKVDIFHLHSTPISLVLDESYDINSQAALVDFPLNPGSEKTAWTWKASDKAPLLVFDPKHEGQIKSAQQLFGNWTFGGKKLASLDSSKPQKAQPWQHGYEALATLDSNGDGVLAAEELKDLALWSDSNKNAISEAGEVKALAEFGIKKIFLGPVKEDKANHSFEVAIGFEREKDGRVVYGKSVDWSSEAANTAMELLANKLGLLSARQMPQTLDAEKASVEKAEPKPVAKSQTAEPSNLIGVWAWNISPRTPGSPVNNGLFVLSAKGEELSGTTLSQVPFRAVDGGKPVGRMKIDFAKFSGTVQAKSDKTQKLKFKTPIPGGVVENQAEVAADGKTMSGTSTATYNEGGQRKTLTYSWHASKKAGLN